MHGTRIVGGHLATKPYPYQVSIQVNGTYYLIVNGPPLNDGWSHHCGGAIITKNAVLTAAHCVYHNQPQYFPSQYLSLFVGSNALDGDGIRYSVSKSIGHQKYIPNGSYDIGMMITSTEIQFIPNRVRQNRYFQNLFLTF